MAAARKHGNDHSSIIGDFRISVIQEVHLLFSRLQANLPVENRPGSSRTVLCQRAVSVDDVISARTVGYHCDRIADLVFDELDVLAAVFRQLFVGTDAADIAFPAGQNLVYRLRFFQLAGNRKLLCHLTVDFIANANRDFIQIPQNVQNGQRNVSRTSPFFSDDRLSRRIRRRRRLFFSAHPLRHRRFQKQMRLRRLRRNMPW